MTVDVHTHELARPFLVLATQNPIEYEGTYPLPEAQVDRFMVRLSLGYPDAAGEAGMLAAHESGDRVASLEPVADGRRAARRAGRRARVCTPPRRCAPTSSRCCSARARTRASSSAPARAPACCCCAPPRRARCCRAATTPCPTTCSALARRCSAHRIVLAPEAFEVTGERIVADALAADPRDVSASRVGRRHAPARGRAAPRRPRCSTPSRSTSPGSRSARWPPACAAWVRARRPRRDDQPLAGARGASSRTSRSASRSRSAPAAWALPERAAARPAARRRRRRCPRRRAARVRIDVRFARRGRRVSRRPAC